MAAAMIAAMFAFAPQAFASNDLLAYIANHSGSDSCKAGIWPIHNGGVERVSAVKTLAERVTGACVANRDVDIKIFATGLTDAKNTITVNGHRVVHNISEGESVRIHYNQVNFIFDYIDTPFYREELFRFYAEPNVATAKRLVWREGGHDKCLDLHNGTLRAGNFLQLFHCNSTAAQAITVHVAPHQLQFTGSNYAIGSGYCVARPQHTAATASAVIAQCGYKHNDNLAMRVNAGNSSIVTTVSPFSCLVPYPGTGNRPLHFIACPGPDGQPGSWSLVPF